MHALSRRRWVWMIALFGALQVVGALSAQNDGPKKKAAPKRAKRPTFEAKTVERVFFKDVFSELVGPRPADISKAAPIASAPTGNGGSAGSETPTSKGVWPSLIMASTLEDEVKQLKILVDKDVTTPSDFNGRGYKVCRVHFTTLAALFGVIHEYDGDVRWKRSARAARDLFARTAANAKVGTPQVYNEAKLRKQDLQDLVSGSNVDVKEKPEPPTWGDLVDRSPLMQRLEISVNERLKSMLSNEGQFKRDNEKVLHEAEIVAILSELLSQEGMEDGDDEDYAGYADKMRDAAREVVEGVKLNDYERARKAIGVVDQACAECHELYRA